jgi:hypothetical protein
MPFFKRRPDLCAASGSVHPRFGKADKLGLELSLFGQFRCDIAVGDSTTNSYTLVELEDAREYSVFEGGKHRQYRRWSVRFEHGFSQLVDWAWRLSQEAAASSNKEPIFGRLDPDVDFLLIIGRRHWISDSDARRIPWRAKNNQIQGHQITIWTYDDAFEILDRRMRTAEESAKPSRKIGRR